MSETSKPNNSNLIDVKDFSKRFAEWAKKHGVFLQKFGEISAKNEISWGSLVEENAQKYPNKIAIKFEEITLTYKEFNEKVNQYTNYFISLGLKKGDIAKVLIKNRIEFLLVYTANAKIGVISSNFIAILFGYFCAFSSTKDPHEISFLALISPNF
ncbi:MAG TPA: hypothetical protein ENI29_17535 [bacterium]|nr:hypothetical protein [bacterium]